MKKKLSVTLVAAALAALLVFCLVGCTVSGTYESAAFGKIVFSGSSFTYTPKIGSELKGKFEGKNLTDEDKEDAEAVFTLAKLNTDTIKGGLVLKDENGKEIAVGFYGKNADDKDYVVVLGFVNGAFTK